MTQKNLLNLKKWDNQPKGREFRDFCRGIGITNDAFSSSVTAREWWFLHSMARIGGTSRVLEIGCWHHVSTLALLSGLPYTAELTTIDVKYVNENFWNEYPKFDGPKWNRIIGPSQVELPKIKNKVFDLIFIDGDHSVEGLRQDLVNSLDVLSPYGTICVHDANSWFKSSSDGQHWDMVKSVLPADMWCFLHNPITRAKGIAIYQKGLIPTEILSKFSFLFTEEFIKCRTKV